MNAIKEHNDKTATALAIVAKINLIILQRQEQAHKDGVNYGHVGDMARIVGDLTNMVEYL